MTAVSPLPNHWFSSGSAVSDGSCVQDDWTIETEEVRHDRGKVGLPDTGADGVDFTGTTHFRDR